MSTVPPVSRPLTNRQKDVVRALACVMWADGNAAPTERAIIEDVIDALAPSEAERREMLTWLDTDCCSLADIELERLSEEEKELLLTDAALLTNADDIVLPSEKAILEKLAQRLSVDGEALARIMADARDDGVIGLPGTALQSHPPAPPADATDAAATADPDAPEEKE
jgi:tellurite resistance protein